MRIAVIHSNADYLIGLRLPLICEMRHRGHDVIAMAPNLTEGHIEVLERLGVKAISCRLSPTGLNPFTDLLCTLELATTLSKLKLGMLLTNTAKPVIFGSIAASLAGVPKRYALVSGLGYAFTDDGVGGWRKRVFRRILTGLYALAFRLNRKVIFHNADDMGEMVAAKVCPQNAAAFVAGSGVDLERFQFGERSHDIPVFIMVSRLLVEKGVKNYLEAACLTKKQFPNARFLLVGARDGNPSALDVGEVERYVSDGTIEWAGGLADVRPWLYRANIFVLPSYREGVPRSTLEAMAAGLAIVTTDVPGCRETVRSEVNGLLVPVRDTQALSQGMTELCKDMDRVASMGRESRRLAEERFSVVEINEEMCRLFELPSTAEGSAES